MAVISYSGNVNFGSFDTWSNNISSDSNVSLSSAMGDMYPVQSAPYNVSTLNNEKIFYGTFSCGTGGTISLTAPYSVGATTSFTAKNVIISDHNITVVATASYPYAFSQWRGDGTVISTSATLTLTDTSHTSVTAFYAEFTTSHVDP